MGEAGIDSMGGDGTDRSPSKRSPPERNRLFTRLSRSSIRFRLGLLIAVAFLPLAIVSLIVLKQKLDLSLGHSRETVLLARGMILARADTAFDRLHEALAESALRGASLDDPGTCRTTLREIIDPQKTELTNIAVFDERGAIDCAAFDPAVSGRSDFGFVDQAWLSRVRTGGRFALGGVGAGTATGRPVIVGALPVSSAQRARVIVAGLRLDYLAPLEGGHRAALAAWLLPSAGAPIAIGRADDRALPTPPTLALLQDADEITPIVRSAGGVPFLYAAADLNDDFRVVAGYGVALDRRHAHAAMWWEGLSVGLLMLLGLGTAVHGASVAVIRPLKRLRREVASWQAGGRFDAGAARNAPLELQELADCFLKAASWLTEREVELRGAATQQELLMQEIHHRVKNNLQIVASLLNLQAARIRQPEARAEFQSARDRVRALATLHRHLYSHGEVHTINMRSFLAELCGQLFQAMGEQENDRIRLDIRASELRMSSDQAVPMALIVTEAVSNAVKYAFPGGRRGHVSVSLEERDGAVRLEVRDDGVGIPAGRVETETGTRDGIGIQLIRGFARQLGAKLLVTEGGDEGGGGTRYEVLLPARPGTRPEEALSEPAPVG